jgi:cell division protein FtsB
MSGSPDFLPSFVRSHVDARRKVIDRFFIEKGLPMRYMIASIALLLTVFVSSVVGQDKANELSRLKQENQRLEAKLQVAELKIQRLEKQIAELKAKKDDDASENTNDLFAAGTTWTGTRNYNQNGASKGFQDWKLVITERKGKRFEGDILFQSIDGQNQSLQVQGTAPTGASGDIEFKTKSKGLLQQKFSGKLADGQIGLLFSGTGLRGNSVSGTGTLKQ